MIVNGEELSDSQVEYYRRVLRNDCIKFAGEFHNMCRSRTFRANWPNEYEFAETNWKTFVSAVRQMYAARLRETHIKPDEAETIFRCLVIDAMTNAAADMLNQPADTSLQLVPDSQAFAGDKSENAAIVEKFGARRTRTFKRALRNSATKFH